jgi:hypothetical protein
MSPHDENELLMALRGMSQKHQSMLLALAQSLAAKNTTVMRLPLRLVVGGSNPPGVSDFFDKPC